MSHSQILLEAGTNELEIIEFYIDEIPAGESKTVRCFYGVNVAKVLEVIESPRLTAYESAAHPCYLGTIPLRDLILPVLDLSVWLGVKRVKNAYEVILVTEFNKTVTGFLVSGVTMIHRVGWADVEPPSRYLSRMESNCITGMVKLEEHFALLLDLEKILAELDPGYGLEHGEIAPTPDRGYKALIADDSTTLRMIIKKKLTEAHFRIESENDGEEAWNRLCVLRDEAKKQGKRINDVIDVVISDIEMPRMDGYTLTKRIKSDPDLKGLPVILFSSLITEELRHKGDSVHADDQISKPEFGALAERAITLIERYRAL